MSLYILALYVALYLSLGFLFIVMAMEIMDGDIDDYLFAFLLFWPIVLLVASVFQLIHFIERMFKGDYWYLWRNWLVESNYGCIKRD